MSVELFREQNSISCNAIPVRSDHRILGGSGGAGVKQDLTTPASEPARRKPARKRWGDCFADIASQLQIEPKEEASCNCQKSRGKMNEIAQPSDEQFAELADELRAKTKHYTRAEKLRAATLAVTTGLVLEGIISPLDPIPGLMRIALKRAEKESPE